MSFRTAATPIVPLLVAAVVVAVSLVWWHARAAEAQEGPIIVNYLLDDERLCDTECSFREAILSAPSAGTVKLPADRFILTLGKQIVIDKSLTIEGEGSDVTFIEPSPALASSTVRVFRITAADVVISDVTIRHGNVSGNGGAILNEGGLTIKNSILTANHASINGGAVANEGTLRLVNTTIIDNNAGLNGGSLFNGNSSKLTIEQSFVRDNSGLNGGGVYNELRGTLDIAEA